MLYIKDVPFLDYMQCCCHAAAMLLPCCCHAAAFQGWLCGHARVVLSSHVCYGPATTRIPYTGALAPSGVLGLKLSNVRQKTKILGCDKSPQRHISWSVDRRELETMKDMHKTYCDWIPLNRNVDGG